MFFVKLLHKFLT